MISGLIIQRKSLHSISPALNHRSQNLRHRYPRPAPYQTWDWDRWQQWWATRFGAMNAAGSSQYGPEWICCQPLSLLCLDTFFVPKQRLQPSNPVYYSKKCRVSWNVWIIFPDPLCPGSIQISDRHFSGSFQGNCQSYQGIFQAIKKQHLMCIFCEFKLFQ